MTGIFNFKTVGATLALILLQTAQIHAQQMAFKKHGQYILTAAGCVGCHTDVKNNGPKLAGGGKLKTPWGTFYGPNITPDKTYGIGNWSDKDFIRALRKGVSPNGSHYFPVFPYTSFTKMTTRDIRALKAYLFSLPPVAKPNIPHDIIFPFGIRQNIYFWKKLFFDEGPFRQDTNETKEWNRGAYLSKALGHCGECHTPRNFLGGSDKSRTMAGNRDGPDGDSVPNITPDPETGIGNWSHKDIVEVLKIGILPDGDFVGGAMTEVSDNMAKLAYDDLNNIATYLKSLPAVRNRVTGN